ncbi:MAG: hypothetical protein ACJ07L_07415, partial [Opitutales bacterium]
FGKRSSIRYPSNSIVSNVLSELKLRYLAIVPQTLKQQIILASAQYNETVTFSLKHLEIFLGVGYHAKPIT